ncbi:probable E3 ubiquitin-protein ligase TRIML1 [Chanos chanos]|uniref:Probable E3 ubiquitin-protein ligase TRIML1 n=1 Tax=Chanos chanos TaxID=29144 RepID=A0A6J2VGK2_CHACN|nr:probable E3 ubiquitin-protein ligase TRIML1 [Chanos chanos]
MKSHSQKTLAEYEQDLKRQKDIANYRMKKLSAKKAEIKNKTEALKEKIKKKYEDMKRVLEEDMKITLTQLDMETKATETSVEDSIESCLLLVQDLERRLCELSAQREEDEEQIYDKEEERITEVLKQTDPDLIQTDDFKNNQLLSLTINLLLFIRSQVPVSKKLLQSYATEVLLDPDSAHPKLIISPSGDSVTYTDTWQDVPDNPSRFDTTLNVVSCQGFGEGRSYWEVQVSGKTYWELGLTYPNIPRKGREEDCWLGRGPESWCVEYFNGAYTAWHNGVPHELTHVSGRNFQRIGVFSSSEGGLVCFLGADTMTPLYSFCAGTFSDVLYQAVCPGHDNQGTNWTPLLICDASRFVPIL